METLSIVLTILGVILSISAICLSLSMYFREKNKIKYEKAVEHLKLLTDVIEAYYLEEEYLLGEIVELKKQLGITSTIKGLKQNTRKMIINSGKLQGKTEPERLFMTRTQAAKYYL